MNDIAPLLTGDIRRMAHVYRYSSLPLNRRENVAEHTFYATFNVLWMYEQLRDIPGVDLDLGMLLKRATVHDLDESLTGDFLRIVKYGVPGLKSLLDSASGILVEKLEQQLHMSFRDDWACAKEDGIDGLIMKIADLWCVVSFIVEEIRTGNRHFLSAVPEVQGYFADLVMESESLEGEEVRALMTRWCTDTIALMSNAVSNTDDVPGYRITSQESYNDNQGV